MTDPGIYIVLGMHRSGTSLVAGLLHESGVHMGAEKTFRPRPQPQNPRGFYENFDFRRVNDRILERSGYVVKRWSPVVPELRPSARQRRTMRRLVTRYARTHPRWGWKDPRQMLTAPLWHRELERAGLADGVRAVCVYRDPGSVARSMASRGNVSNLSHGYALWHVYNRALLDFIDSSDVTCTVLAFERLCAAPAAYAADKLGSIGIDGVSDQAEALFAEQLVRSSGDGTGSGFGAVCDPDLAAVLGRLEQLEQG